MWMGWPGGNFSKIVRVASGVKIAGVLGAVRHGGQRDVSHRIMQQVTAISDGPSQGRVKTTQLVF